MLLIQFLETVKFLTDEEILTQWIPTDEKLGLRVSVIIGRLPPSQVQDVMMEDTGDEEKSRSQDTDMYYSSLPSYENDSPLPKMDSVGSSKSTCPNPRPPHLLFPLAGGTWRPLVRWGDRTDGNDSSAAGRAEISKENVMAEETETGVCVGVNQWKYELCG